MLIKRTPTAPISDYAVIELSKGLTCILDAEDYNHISSYLWIAFKWSYRYYAARKIKHNKIKFWIPMHRQITHCPKGLIVHHENFDTLDNRKQNLTVMTKEQHNWLHGYRVSKCH